MVDLIVLGQFLSKTFFRIDFFYLFIYLLIKEMNDPAVTSMSNILQFWLLETCAVVSDRNRCYLDLACLIDSFYMIKLMLHSVFFKYKTNKINKYDFPYQKVMKMHQSEEQFYESGEKNCWET